MANRATKKAQEESEGALLAEERHTYIGDTDKISCTAEFNKDTGFIYR